MGVTESSLSVSTHAPRTAILDGKAVVNGVGNYAYVVTVTDEATDTFALKVTAPPGAADVGSLTVDASPVRSGGSVTIT